MGKLSVELSTTGWKMTQEESVEQYLRQGNTLTRIECLERYGSIELPRIVYDLKHRKKDPVPIESEMIKGENGKRFARYYIKSEPSFLLEGEQEVWI